VIKEDKKYNDKIRKLYDNYYDYRIDDLSRSYFKKHPNSNKMREDMLKEIEALLHEKEKEKNK
jgi:hypothetical protein